MKIASEIPSKTTPRKLVLITRPVADAGDFADDVRSLGLEPMIEPMLGIVGLPYKEVDLQNYAGLVFTSANAVRIFSCRPEQRDIPVFAVGTHTAREAKKQGFLKVLSAEGDGADLAALICKKLAANSGCLLHVRGEHTAMPLEDMLQKDKIEIEPLVIYTAKTEESFTPDCLVRLKSGSIGTVTFFSKRTAENFMKLARKENLEPQLSGIKALCISPAVLECVRTAPWKEAYSAARPDKAAMLDLLRTLYLNS